MVLTTPAILATLLASTSLASVIHRRQAPSCSTQSTHFLIQSNMTNKYGALGSPCRKGNCGVFFTGTSNDITTVYNLTSSGNLIIAYNDPPTPIGYIAYGNVYGGKPRPESPVLFGTQNYIRSCNCYKPLVCSIQPASEGETCDLVCVLKRGKIASVGDTVNVGNDDQWDVGFLKKEGYEAIQVKAYFPD